MSHFGLRIGSALLFVLMAGWYSPVDAERSERRGIAAQRRIAAGSAHTCAAVGDNTIRCWGWNAFGQLGDGTLIDRPQPTSSRTSSDTLVVVAGAIHTCAIRANDVECWGENSVGQIGDGTTTTRTSRIPLGVTGATGLALGIDHTCALLDTGRVRCWGDNSSGQLGIGTNNPQGTASKAANVTGLADAVAIAAGLFHTCAVRVGGSVVCWGQNDSGQLGNNTTINQLTPVPVANLAQAIDVVAGATHTCALVATGSMRCWGNNAEGELGNGTFNPSLQAIAVSDLTNVKAVSAGWFHTCAVRANATSACWGDNSSGQLGDGTFNNQNRPVAVQNLPVDVVTLAAGNTHTCALRANGSLNCWGFNDLGQLGAGPLGVVSSTPVDPLITGTDLGMALNLGAEHSCAVRWRGTPACWGSNTSGQLNGSSSPTRSAAPVGFPSGTFPEAENVVAIAAGTAHTCVLKVTGTVTCWGNDARGQLGRGSPTTSPAPPTTPVAGLDQVVAISAGDAFTCALRAGGTVRCWGAGDSGQLGNGTVDSATPVSVSSLTAVVAITTGDRHACALRSTGAVRCWGANSDGQLGNNTTSATPTPLNVGVSSLTNARSIAAGGQHTCAIRVTGLTVCWGRNAEGQLGTGNTTPSAVPTALIGQLRLDAQTTIQTTIVATDIAAGKAHNCVASGIRTICWGLNTKGQASTAPSQANQTIPRLIPSPELTPRRRPIVAAGERHSCAIRADGAVFCWGDNSSGQTGGNDDTSNTIVLGQQAVFSFTVNIVPIAHFISAQGVVDLTIVASCLEGQRIEIDVTLEQGTIASSAHDGGQCEGALAEYRVTVPSRSKEGFAPGAARAMATAVIREKGEVVDTQTWTRLVMLQP